MRHDGLVRDYIGPDLIPYLTLKERSGSKEYALNIPPEFAGSVFWFNFGIEGGIVTSQVNIDNVRFAPVSVATPEGSWDNGSGDNDWFNSVNWDPDGFPNPSDQLSITTGTPHARAIVMADDGGSITVDATGTVATFDQTLC
ncbi:MAG: hypothetical protein HQ567_12470, partial [Candidatus Nealsonbacteria bacterium]|nr:hypothetical protein [Candidatus Nealsonbacteria bacterium]